MRRLLLLSLVVVTNTACSSSDEPASPQDGGPDGAATCTFTGEPEPDVPAPKIHTPRWAFMPWISKDISTRDDTYAFVKGFADRDIPVGVVVLDSPWETNYNSLVPNPSRYPELGKMVADLKAQDIRLVLWITQMVNEQSFDLEEGGDHYDGESPNWFDGQACGFFVNGGRRFSWWKGTGAAVDFFNGKARAWWHAQQNLVLDLGVSGFKLDFGDSYMDVDPVTTAAGDVPHQQYSEKYYADYLTYGVQYRGRDEFTTMVRAWDESYDFPGRFFARKEHAPVVWVGDNRRDWIGLKDALNETLISAKAGYVVIGSDVGGYLDRDDKNISIKVPADTMTFARWTATSALLPFMELHGRANLTPWTVDDHVDETVKLYRYWSKLHAALVPFFYSLAEEAYAKGDVIIHPIASDATTWVDDYRFQIGDAFLVAPIVDATGKRDVAFPAGARWYDWWAPAAPAIEGGTTIAAYDATARDRLPFFVREGAIMPLDVTDDANALGTTASKGTRTVLVWPAATKSTFVLHEDDDTTTTIEAARGEGTTITFSRLKKATLVRVHVDAVPTAIDEGTGDLAKVADRAAFDAASTGWFHEPTTSSVWIKIPEDGGSRTLTLR